jgi:hypothetical protein
VAAGWKARRGRSRPRCLRPCPGYRFFCLDGGYQYFGIRRDRAGSGAGTSGIAARAGGSPFFNTRCGPATGIQDGDSGFNADEDAFGFDDNNDGDPGDVMAASGGLGLNCPAGLCGKAEPALTERPGACVRAGYAYADLDASPGTPGGLSINVEDPADGPASGALPGAGWKF